MPEPGKAGLTNVSISQSIFQYFSEIADQKIDVELSAPAHTAIVRQAKGLDLGCAVQHKTMFGLLVCLQSIASLQRCLPSPHKTTSRSISPRLSPKIIKLKRTALRFLTYQKKLNES